MRERLTFNYGTAAQAVVARELEARQQQRQGTDARPVAAGRDTDVDWGFRGLLLFTFVLFFRPQDHALALEPLHLAELTAVLALGGMAIRRIKLRLPVAPLLPEVFAILALGLVMLLTAPFSIWMGGSVRVFGDVFLKALLIFILMMHALATPRRLEQFVGLILFACAYLAFRAIFDYVRGVNLVEYGRAGGAVGGMFYNPNDLAMNLVTFLPFALATVAVAIRPWKRVAAAAVAFLVLTAIVCTQSRGGAIGLGAVLVVVAAWLLRRRPMALGAAVLATMMLVPFVPDSYWRRLASIGNEELDQTGSREARRVLMEEAFDAMMERPLTGVGAGQFRNYKPETRREPWRETHNVLLQLGADVGIFGPIILLYLIYRGLSATRTSRQLLRELRRHPERAVLPLTPEERNTLELYVAACGAGLIGWLVCAQFLSIAYNWTFYYVLALAVVPREILKARLGVRRAPAPAPVGIRREAHA